MSAAAADAERFAELFQRGSRTDVLFFREMKAAMRKARLPYWDNATIIQHVKSTDRKSTRLNSKSRE